LQWPGETTEAGRRGLELEQHCNPNEIQYQGKLAAISGWRTRLRPRFETSVNESILEAFRRGQRIEVWRQRMKIVLFLMLGLLSLGIISFAVDVPDADLAILLDLLAVLLLFLAFGLAQDYGMSKMTQTAGRGESHNLPHGLPAGILTLRGSGKFNDPIQKADTGVTIQSITHPGAQEFASSLIAELNKRGYDAARQKNRPFDKNPDPQIWVKVEMRPKGPQGEFELQAIREQKRKE
jgi:hypothetical protein